MIDGFNELYFLNPSADFETQLWKYIEANGFVMKYLSSDSKQRRYIKGDRMLSVYSGKDYVGHYISILCHDIEDSVVRNLLSKCPECGSFNLQSVIPFHIIRPYGRSYINELEEGKVVYQPAAYDRMDTKCETKRCINCGCKWHNSSDLKYWWNTVFIYIEDILNNVPHPGMDVYCVKIEPSESSVRVGDIFEDISGSEFMLEAFEMINYRPKEIQDGEMPCVFICLKSDEGKKVHGKYLHRIDK